MSKKVAGYLIIALSGLFFAFELYGLQFLHVAQFGRTSHWNEYPLAYLGEPAVLIAFLITACVFIFGVCLAAKKNS